MHTKQPYIGKIVHYYPSVLQREHYAAIIIAVSHSLVGLRVFFADGSEAHMDWVEHRSNTSDGECWDYAESRSKSPEEFLKNHIQTTTS